MKTKTLPCLLAATSLGLAGCTSTTPALDARFGETVTAARAQQVIDPAASLRASTADGIDGRAARHTMTRYQESFRTPPGSFEATNIGGGFSSGSGGQ